MHTYDLHNIGVFTDSVGSKNVFGARLVLIKAHHSSPYRLVDVDVLQTEGAYEVREEEELKRNGRLQ